MFQGEGMEAASPEHEQELRNEREPVAKAARVAGRSFQPLDKITWGCFVIARKKQKGKPDSFEARCPFHKKNQKTKCKKTFSLRFGMEGSAMEDIILNALKHWCNAAQEFEYQTDHVGYLPEPWGVPIFEEPALDGLMLSSAPEVVLTDEGKLAGILCDVQADQEAQAGPESSDSSRSSSKSSTSRPGSTGSSTGTSSSSSSSSSS